MWELATVYRGDWATREGWGWHDPAAWELFLSTITEIGQLSEPVAADAIIANEFVAGANDFDREKVAADAAGFALSPEFEAVAVPEGAGA
jgi:NitT/TauT family transport system substrate-binding protein